MIFNITENNRKWWIFAAMAAALSIVFLDQTAISVTLPAIQKDLGVNNIMLQWVINTYLVSLATLIIFGGKLGDIFGHKRTFLIGITLFTLSSISCAIAPSGFWIIASRAIQGVGGALMIPVTSVIIAHAFNENERGRAIGLYVATASIFLSLGPLLSGLLTHYLSWRWVFWINLPISLFSFCLTLLSVPASENHREFKPLDWLGFITLSIFITALVIALMEGISWGWSSMAIISLMITAILFVIIFIVVETQAPDPLVRLSLFTQKDFLGANLCLLFLQCAFASSVFWAILLQNVMKYSAVTTGLFYLPVTLPVMFMAPLGGMLRDKYGPRLPVAIGAITTTIAALWIAFSAFAGNYLAMFPGFLLFGLGPSLIYSSVMATAINSVPFSQRGMATGVVSGVRQLGSVLGVAIIGLVISNIEHYRLKTALTTLSGNVTHVTIQQLSSLLSGSASVKNVLLGFSASEIDYLYRVLRSAYTVAFSVGMVVSAMIVFLAFIACLLLPNRTLMQGKAPEKFQ